MKPLDSQPADEATARAWMSALADGRADAGEAAFNAWAHEADARQAWHSYHLIGDVLRSEDLASPAQHDEAFLQAFRQRLAKEPVVLAPEPLPKMPAVAAQASRQGRSSLRWGSAAAAAGVIMVGGAFFALQRSETAQPLAQVKPSAPASTLVEVDTQQWRMLDERVLRDANLDAYMRAHRGNSVVGGRVERVVLER